MAEDDTTPPAPAAGKTEYRIFRKVTPEEITSSLENDSTALELYVLEPNAYDGNVKRAVYDDLGEGDYIKVSARSVAPFVIRTKSVVTFTE